MCKRLPTIYFLLIALALLNACVIIAPAAVPTTMSGVPAAESSETRGFLRVPHRRLWGEKASLDPSSPVRFSLAIPLLYDRMVRIDKNGKPIPELAKSWSANGDATEWTFTLQDGVTFHNGKTFTSVDVVYTFEHILDPDFQSPAASILGLITKIEAPDDTVIIFKLDRGHADFPLLLGNLSTAIIQMDSAGTVGESGIGTGPFWLESRDAESITILRANDDYWKGAPGLAGIELISIPDAEARVLAAQAGQVDLLLETSPAQAALFEGNDNFNMLSFPSGRFTTLVMRTDTPPFDDVRVRKAVRLAADRQQMIDLVLNGAGTVACDTPVAPTDAYRWESDCPQDIEQAKSLLAEAGYADGLDVTLYASNLDSQMIPLAQVYQQQAAAAGINVTLEIAPADSFFSEIWRIVPFFVSYWNERPADQMLNEAWRSTAKWNESYFQNPDFDRLLDEARVELDFKLRRAKYQAAQQLLFKESGHLIPYHTNQSYIVNVKVSGIPPIFWRQFEWHTISKSE